MAVIRLGKITRWKNSDGIFWAENDFVRMAYAVFDPKTDEMKPFGFGVRNATFVELITAEQAQAWNNAPTRN